MTTDNWSFKGQVNVDGTQFNQYKKGSAFVEVQVGLTFNPFDTIELSDLDGKNGFVLNGVSSGDQSGYSVSAAGDVNGDGFADVLVGAVYADPNGAYSGASLS